jgi:hypothetical protein
VLVKKGVGASLSVGFDRKGRISSFYVTCKKRNFAVNRKELVVFPVGFHDKSYVHKGLLFIIYLLIGSLMCVLNIEGINKKK